ncbi:MAG: hypothetical protein ACKVXR_05545 [Planctomycetota bacterium]
MVSTAVPRTRTGWWTLLLAFCLALLQGSCCTCPQPDSSPISDPAGPVDGAPPVVRGRARWFNQPTTNPVLPSIDMWIEEAQKPALVNKMEIFWQITNAVDPTYPQEPQEIRDRSLDGNNTPLDWFEYSIFAHDAYIANMADKRIQVQVLVTNSKGTKWTFHKLLPLDGKYKEFEKD